MIEIKNVSKTYNNNIKAIDNLNLKINDGEIVGFIGLNGAGKTTAIKMMTGILQPDIGTIKINGYDIVKDSLKAKQIIGYIADSPDMFLKLTGMEFINFIANIIQHILIPIVFIIVVFSIISKISEKVQIEKLSKCMKSGVVWILGVILTIFVGVVSLEGTLSSSIDGITAKTAKAAISSLIPVVRKDIRRQC